MTDIPHRHTKSVRRFPDNEIGIKIGATEYVMPISEANELVSMIYAARHAEPLNWAGAALMDATSRPGARVRDAVGVADAE
jgi:hypothetical protein